MKPSFNTVTIIGAGLLGGSLGLALKKRGMAATVNGFGHREVTLKKALDVGAIDKSFTDLRESVVGADLVVICTPAAKVVDVLDGIRDRCAPNAVITDVASTKTDICRHACETWPRPCRFVGSHPMAGSEKHGPENADPELYGGSVVLVETGEHLDPEARACVCAMWRALDAAVVNVTPEAHDAAVARTSHLPHILASCMAVVAARDCDVEPFVGQGFRDFTRIAASRPEIWRDICLTNRDGIVPCLDELTEELQRVRAAILEGNGETVEEVFRSGNEARRKALGE